MLDLLMEYVVNVGAKRAEHNNAAYRHGARAVFWVLPLLAIVAIGIWRYLA